MIDHVSLTVRDVEACKAFYDAAFAPLDIEW
jgi:catechol 2,3-dioxygenase-like lactoylglutathione lyase family enzyme